MRTPNLNIPDAITDRLPTRLTAKKSRLARLRKPVGISGIVVASVALLAGAVKVLRDNRYISGSAQLISITEDDGEGGIIVRLHGMTFWAPAEQQEDIEAAGKAGVVPFRVDRLRSRRGGLLTGEFYDQYNVTVTTYGAGSQD
jgi:hypothetical protein